MIDGERKPRMQERKMFDTGLTTYSQRKDNLNDLLETDKIHGYIEREVMLGKTAACSYSGWLTDRLGEYLISSHDLPGSRRGSEPFYVDEAQYSKRKIVRATRLLAGEDNRDLVANYQRQKQQNMEDYIAKLFDANELTETNIANFIKLGCYNKMPDGIKDKYLLGELAQIREGIKNSCKSFDDVILLNYFDGKRKIVQIADELGVTHQAISKKIKKIAKNCLKWLRS